MQQVATKETRERLGRVNFRKDFWDCNRRKDKKLANTDLNIQRRDRIENVKKRFNKSKNNFARAPHFFVHFCAFFSQVPYFAFYRERNLATTKFYFPFWTWIWSLGILLQGGSPTFDKVSW